MFKLPVHLTQNTLYPSQTLAILPCLVKQSLFIITRSKVAHMQCVGVMIGQVVLVFTSGVPRGGWGVQTPPKIPKALKKSCQTQTDCENC